MKSEESHAIRSLSGQALHPGQERLPEKNGVSPQTGTCRCHFAKNQQKGGAMREKMKDMFVHIGEKL